MHWLIHWRLLNLCKGELSLDYLKKIACLIQPETTLSQHRWKKKASLCIFFSRDFTRFSYKLDSYKAGRVIGKALFYLFSPFLFEIPFDFTNIKNRQQHQIKGLNWEDQTNTIRLQDKSKNIWKVKMFMSSLLLFFPKTMVKGLLKSPGECGGLL